MLWPLAVAACGPADGSPPLLTASRDSAGIAIVENVRPDADGVPVWTYGQVFDIGDVGGRGPMTFFQVAGAALLSSAGIAVADAGSGEIRFFDAGGEFLHSTGGRGGGPGEFRSMRLAGAAADSLFVYDAVSQELSVITRDGAFARETPFFEDAIAGELVGRLPDGTWVGRTADLASKIETRPGFNRQPVHVVRIPVAGAPDTIGTFPGREMFYRAAGKGLIGSSPPFGRELRMAISGERLWVSTGDDSEIRQYDCGGRLQRIIRTRHEPTPVTPRLIEAFIADRAARLPALKRPADVPPEQWIRESIEGVPTPPALPAYGAMVPGTDGELWVSDFHDPVAPSGDWTVFAADGAVVARVRLPDGFRIFDVGREHLLGTVLDEMDVEHIRLYRRS